MAYPQLIKYYGILSGFGFYATYSVFGMLVGQVVDRVNRKNFLAGMVILCSLSTFMTGAVNSLVVLVLMRLILGIT